MQDTTSRKRLLWIALALSAFAAARVAYGAFVVPDKIRKEVVKANYCETASDCRFARGSCNIQNVAFWIPVNKNETQRIENLVSQAISFKMAACARPEPSLECVNRKCYESMDFSAESAPESKPMTLEGAYGCLPRAGGDDGHIFRCVPALLADDGTSYALDFNMMYAAAPSELKPGDRFMVEGVFTPIHYLSDGSADFWRKYDVAGTFSVALESFRKR